MTFASPEALDAIIAALKTVGVEVWPGHGFLFPSGLGPAAEAALAALTLDEQYAVIDHAATLRIIAPHGARVPA